ncbi:inorganic diphosphatase [Patescibacteria group bacterium]|nr:inorganic diphosphatase [Patescibacteria group bacterium]MBU1730138.1 inorganic diphosphatase [Patescibacteria group bacterium]MBU1956108.1 inorganic diphosphatase [Patescibacteria group bacterium]
MNLWHEVSAGENIPKEVNVIIEIPKGSKNKYEIDKETGLIALDRAMHTAQDYPFDYGFIPQSFWDDDDALDVILLTTYPLVHGILVNARPVGLMNMIDSGDNDDKIIAVPVDDPRWDKVKDISDVNHHTIKEMEHFFSTYKKIQNKEVDVTGFQDYKAAQEAIVRGLMLYKEKYGEK